MLTQRQWIAIAINLVAGHAVLLAAGVTFENLFSSADFPLGLSAIAVVLMVLAFKLLRWDASWLTIVPTALVVSSGVPFFFFAAPYFFQNLGGALFVGLTITVAGSYLVLPMFILNCVLLRWGTRERRSNR